MSPTSHYNAAVNKHVFHLLQEDMNFLSVASADVPGGGLRHRAEADRMLNTESVAGQGDVRHNALRVVVDLTGHVRHASHDPDVPRHPGGLKCANLPPRTSKMLYFQFPGMSLNKGTFAA